MILFPTVDPPPQRMNPLNITQMVAHETNHTPEKVQLLLNNNMKS